MLKVQIKEKKAENLKKRAAIIKAQQPFKPPKILDPEKYKEATVGFGEMSIASNDLIRLRAKLGERDTQEYNDVQKQSTVDFDNEL